MMSIIDAEKSKKLFCSKIFLEPHLSIFPKNLGRILGKFGKISKMGCGWGVTGTHPGVVPVIICSVIIIHGVPQKISAFRKVWSPLEVILCHFWDFPNYLGIPKFFGNSQIFGKIPKFFGKSLRVATTNGEHHNFKSFGIY